MTRDHMLGLRESLLKFYNDTIHDFRYLLFFNAEKWEAV